MKKGPEAREAEIIEQESTYVALLADRDRLRSELDAVAKERSGPHCLRCRNAAVCSTRDDDRSIPLCVTDPDGSMPLWEPVTLADVQAVASELDAARAELARARLAYIRQIERRAAKHCAEWAQVIRSMGCWDPQSYQGRRLARIRKVRDACRAELARMEDP